MGVVRNKISKVYSGILKKYTTYSRYLEDRVRIPHSENDDNTVSNKDTLNRYRIYLCQPGKENEYIFVYDENSDNKFTTSFSDDKKSVYFDVPLNLEISEIYSLIENSSSYDKTPSFKIYPYDEVDNTVPNWIVTEVTRDGETYTRYELDYVITSSTNYTITIKLKQNTYV